MQNTNRIKLYLVTCTAGLVLSACGRPPAADQRNGFFDPRFYASNETSDPTFPGEPSETVAPERVNQNPSPSANSSSEVDRKEPLQPSLDQAEQEELTPPISANDEPQSPLSPVPANPISEPQPQDVQTSARVQIRGMWDEPQYRKKIKSGSPEKWTPLTVGALTKFGANLLRTRPMDVKEFCPNYASLSQEGRMAFWTYFVSAIAYRESRFKVEAKYDEKETDSRGQPTISRGLMQISFSSGRNYPNCRPADDQALHIPEVNLTCGVIILDRWISRDKRVTGKNERDLWMGAARYFAVLRTPETRRFIAGVTSQISICRK